MVLGNAGTMVSQVFNMPQGIAFAKQYSAPGLTRYLSSLIKRMADPEGFAATNPMAKADSSRKDSPGICIGVLLLNLGRKPRT